MTRQSTGQYSESSRRPAWPSPYLLLSLSALFWAGNAVVGRAMHEAVPPVTLAFWRWSIALVILLPWIARPLARQWRAVAANWRAVLLLSVLGVAAYNTLLYSALQTTTATNGLLVNSACTAMIIAVNYLMFGTRSSARQWAGLALSIAGTLVIVSRGALSALAALDLVRGDVLLLVGALYWAVYTACLRWRPPGLDGTAFLGVNVMIAVVLLAPLSLLESLDARPVVFTPAVAAGIAYTGIFPSVLAYLFWNRAVGEVGGNRAGHFLNLVPVFGTVLAVTLLRETLQPFHLVGATLIFGGIYLATRRSR